MGRLVLLYVETRMNHFSILVVAGLVILGACRHPLLSSDSGPVSVDGGAVTDDGGMPSDGGADGGSADTDGGSTSGDSGGVDSGDDSGTPSEVDWGDCTFEQISAGSNTTCVLTRSKQIACWGYEGWEDYYGYPPSGEFQSMTSSTDSSASMCGLRPDGRVECWFDYYPDSVFVTSVPEGTFVQVDDSGRTACVLDAAGVATCWGDVYDSYGVYEPQDDKFSRVAASSDANCGVTTDGSVHCWGLHGDPHDYWIWSEITDHEPTGNNFVDIYLYDDMACALDADGNASCWGLGWYLDPFVTPLSYTSTVFIGELNGPFTQLSFGGRSPGGCGVTIEGDIECLVYHTDASILVPPTFLPGPYKQVAYGYDHACALDADGRASCWRVNDFGSDDAPELIVPCEKEKEKEK
jgi:Regulator of chromosome condensation (RCC1) repeat